MRATAFITTLLRLTNSSTVTTLSPLNLLRRSMSTTSGADPISPSNTRVGWIGTGVMGRSMCAHLIAAGYSLTIFTRTPSKAQPLLDLGARFASSPLAVASHSDVVFSIVGYPSDVHSVLISPTNGAVHGLRPGAVHGLRPGAVLVDMTTSDPSLAVEIASVASDHGCSAVDAPVSGGDRGARAGTLAIFAGGDEAVVERLEPLFKCLGRVSYMGGAGKGQSAKLANQITIASTMVGLVEGMVYARKAGLDVDKYLEAISTGAAGSKLLDSHGSRILKRDFEAGFYVNHFVKDLGICLRECEKMGIGLPGLALAQQLYVSLQANGEGGLGTQALVLALERLNNISLEAAPSSSTSQP